jgi:hypothetical protein
MVFQGGDNETPNLMYVAILMTEHRRLAKTSKASRVAPQHCPVLLMRKSF